MKKTDPHTGKIQQTLLQLSIIYLKPTYMLFIIVDISVISRFTQFVSLIILIHYALYEAGSSKYYAHTEFYTGKRPKNKGYPF